MARWRLINQTITGGWLFLLVVWLLTLGATVVFLGTSSGSGSADCGVAGSSYGTGHVDLAPLGTYCTFDPPTFRDGRPPDETGARVNVVNASVETFLLAVPLILIVRDIAAVRRDPPAEGSTT